MAQCFKPLIASLTGMILAGASLLACPGAIADVEETRILLTDPLSFPEDFRLLESGQPLPEDILTADTISQEGLTRPSLWWTQEQFGGKLLNTWLVYLPSHPFPRVDLVVNQQVWSLYTYAERYAFVNHFGTVARDYGYNLRVFNREQTLLAAYICDSSLPTPDGDPVTGNPDCDLFLSSAGTGALQGRFNRFGGFPSINGGTGQP